MIRIIPAIDIIDGNCVRLTEGDFETKRVYYKDPLDVAKMFEDNGVKYLHMVDLDGARQRKVINFKVLENVATNTSLIIDFGGGIQSDEDIRIAFESGALAITAGTWTISPAQSLNIYLAGYLPVEEFLFFLITTTLVVFGITLVLARESQSRVPTVLRSQLAKLIS